MVPRKNSPRTKMRKVLAVKPPDPSSALGSHTVEREPNLTNFSLIPMVRPWHGCTQTNKQHFSLNPDFFLPPCSQQSSVSWVRDLWTFSGLVFFTEASSCPYAVLTLLFPYKPGVFHRCSSTVPSSSERPPYFGPSISIDTHAESIGNKDRKSAQSKVYRFLSSLVPFDLRSTN